MYCLFFSFVALYKAGRSERSARALDPRQGAHEEATLYAWRGCADDCDYSDEFVIFAWHLSVFVSLN
jgi:hypothetical protein